MLQTEKGWVKFESWEEFTAMAGYIPEINPKVSGLKEVIGSYREPEFKTCCISSCHTKHYRGYIVSTDDGHMTNIGVNCGNKHFGIDFEHMRYRLDRDVKSQLYREMVDTAQNKVADWQQKCEALKPSASALIKQNRQLHNRDNGLPDYINQELANLMRAQDNMLTRTRNATEEEKEIGRTTGSPIEVITENIGILNGLSGIRSIDDIRKILILDLEVKLKELTEIDIDSASDKDVEDLAKWVGEVDSKIGLVSSIIDSCNLFFDKENISLLAEISENSDDEKRVMNIARQYG